VSRDRRGIALLMALLVLGVAGLFLVAGYHAARSDDRAARISLRVAQLDGANQASVALLVATWDSAARFAQPVGSTQEVPVPSPDPGARTSLRVTRLSTHLYMAAPRSRDAYDTTVTAGGLALLRVEGPVFPLLAGLVARGDVGPPEAFQYVPPDSAAAQACRSGLPARPTIPGFAVPPGRVAPVPSIQTAQAGQDSTYRLFGSVSLDALAARATVELPVSVPTQAPTARIAVARGDLTLSGGAGRGVLLVYGRLTIDGLVTYRGVIVTLGGMDLRSSGSTVDGLILVDGGEPIGVVANNSSIMNLRLDPCVITDVSWHGGRVGPVPEWGQPQVP
jgi:hypothetical protein